MVIAEFELTGKDLIGPIREALIKGLPAAEKKTAAPKGSQPLKGILGIIQKR